MFVIYCDNKKCGKAQEPLLDPETNEVFCSECGEVITSVSSFAKTAMHGLGQVKKSAKNAQAFAVTCEACKKSAQPKLVKEKLICRDCNHQHKLAPSYEHALKHYLTSQS